MDFARKILNKYGWKEGDGLGKNNNGITKPLRASMKFDNAGLGSDQAASDFNNHWWERVFNEAAGNVDVKANANGVSVELKNKDDSVEISTKGYSLKKLKKAKQEHNTNYNRYDNFLQSATLTKSGDEIENPHKIDIADISVTKYKTLTDEELFRACGGRTAHKGARHGLKLSGKLSRIEQQEQELLAKLEAQKRKLNSNSNERFGKESKKKSKKHKDTIHYDLVTHDSQNASENNSKLNKKNKNKICKPVEEGLNNAEYGNLIKSKRKVSEAETHLSPALSFSDLPKKKIKESNSTPEDESMKKPKKNKCKDPKNEISKDIDNIKTVHGSNLSEEERNNLNLESNRNSKRTKRKRESDESNANMSINVDAVAEMDFETSIVNNKKGKEVLKYTDQVAVKKIKNNRKKNYKK